MLIMLMYNATVTPCTVAPCIVTASHVECAVYVAITGSTWLSWDIRGAYCMEGYYVHSNNNRYLRSHADQYLLTYKRTFSSYGDKAFVIKLCSQIVE